nr:chromosome partitioning protein [Micromonospora echinaurantiaca]
MQPAASQPARGEGPPPATPDPTTPGNPSDDRQPASPRPTNNPPKTGSPAPTSGPTPAGSPAPTSGPPSTGSTAPTSSPPPTGSAAPTSGPTPAGSTASTSGPSPTGSAAPSSGPPPTPAGSTTPTSSPTSAGSATPTSDPTPADGLPLTSDPTPTSGTAPASDPTSTPGPPPSAGPAPGAGRGATSPWAQPPQRSAAESSNGSTGPANAPLGLSSASPGPASASPGPAPEFPGSVQGTPPAPAAPASTAPALVHGAVAATPHHTVPQQAGAPTGAGGTVDRQGGATPPGGRVPLQPGGAASSPGGASGAAQPPVMPQPAVPAPTPQYDASPGPGQDAPLSPAAEEPAGPRQEAPPPGPFPPQPGWYPPGWQQGPPQAGPAPRQPYRPADGVTGVPPAQPDPDWSPETTAPPTAEDFARRRQVRPAEPVATMGVRAVFNKVGLRLPPGRHELEMKRDIEMVRRNFGGLRQVTVVNPKGGAGKTVAILLLAMTFGQKRGGYVLAWDNNETQGTLGMRAQQDFHARTVRDLLRDLGQFQGAHGRIGDLSQYVRSQGEGMFDVLASDESATGGEMLTAAAFAEIREVVSRFYKLIFVDTGNNVRAQNWQAAMDATDQLVVTMSARNDSAETAARMLDHLEQSGRQRLVRQAVSVVSMPPSRKEIDLPAIQDHFAARTRAVLLAPYERLIDTGEPIRYGALSAATRDAWLKIAAAVAEGL